MRSVENRCIEMVKGHQSWMDAEFVRLQETNTKASQKFDEAAQYAQKNLRPRCWQQRGCDVDGDRRLQECCSAVG